MTGRGGGAAGWEVCPCRFVGLYEIDQLGRHR